MADEWIGAYSARGLAMARRSAVTTDAIKAIEYAIIDHARTVLPARAGYQWEKIVHDESSTLKREAHDAVIPQWAWELTEETTSDWASGTFHLAGDRNGELTYVKLVGVEFRAAEFDRLWPATQAAVKAASVETDGRATATNADVICLPKNAKMKEWQAFWLAAMEMLYAGQLDKNVYRSQASLRRELLTRIDDCLSDDSIKPMVSHIWHKFVEQGG